MGLLSKVSTTPYVVHGWDIFNSAVAVGANSLYRGFKAPGIPAFIKGQFSVVGTADFSVQVNQFITLGPFPVSAAALNAAGVKYSVGDVLTLAETIYTAPATVVVDSVGAGGAIATSHLAGSGAGYVSQVGVAAFGGTGSGATFDVTASTTSVVTIEGVSVNAVAIVVGTLTIPAGTSPATGIVVPAASLTPYAMTETLSLDITASDGICTARIELYGI
jgi:hypothetical protein